MINKIVNSSQEAIQDIYDDATVMIGGFGEAGKSDRTHSCFDRPWCKKPDCCEQ